MPKSKRNPTIKDNCRVSMRRDIIKMTVNLKIDSGRVISMSVIVQQESLGIASISWHCI